MCEECPWADYVEKMEEMSVDPKYDFASDTILGILDWVQTNEHITDRQIEAVDNIEGAR